MEMCWELSPSLGLSVKDVAVSVAILELLDFASQKVNCFCIILVV